MSLKTRFVAVVALTLTLVFSASALRAANLVEQVESEGQFKTWASAVQAAGLTERLSNDGPYTIFAPTDEAFARLPDGTVEALLSPRYRKQLVDFVEHHVVEGRFVSSRMAGRAMWISTVHGDRIYIDGRQKAILIDAAEAIETDIETSNGVIHAIDNVILPTL